MTRPRAMTDASGAYGAGGGAGGHHLAGGVVGGGDAGGDGGGSGGHGGQVQQPASTRVVRRLSHCSGAAPSRRGRGRGGQPHPRRRVRPSCCCSCFPFLGVTAPGDVQRNARVTNTYSGTVSSPQHSSFFCFIQPILLVTIAGKSRGKGAMSESVEVECVRCRDKGVTCTLSPLHSHASLLFFLPASPQARTALRHVYLPVRNGTNAQSVWRDRRGRARGACVGGKTGGRGVSEVPQGVYHAGAGRPCHTRRSRLGTATLYSDPT